MEIHFAPLQGHTDFVYRNRFQKYFGGVDYYYTPFIRFGKDGEVRKKDVKDIDPVLNAGMPVVPQVLAGDEKEMEHLLNLLSSAGYGHVDLNLGCPFPMVVKSGRGSGLLVHPERVEALLSKAEAFKAIQLSVKVRLGLNSPKDALKLFPLFEKYKVKHVTVHARTTVQQYKGQVDLDSFAELSDNTSVPLLFNGDVKSADDIHNLQERFPHLRGVMIGRGLLEDPFLGMANEGKILTKKEKYPVLVDFHHDLLNAYGERLSGDSHVLSKIKTLWDYLLPDLTGRDRKQIKKTKSLEAYKRAVEAGMRNWAMT